MLIQEDHEDSPFLLRSYTPATAENPSCLVIGNQRYQSALIIYANIQDISNQIRPWSVESTEQLSSEDAKQLCEGLKNSSGILLLGTGPRFIIPPASFRDAVQASNIGMEFMDTAAACRSFIALMAEGRQVIAALIL